MSDPWGAGHGAPRLQPLALRLGGFRTKPLHDLT